MNVCAYYLPEKTKSRLEILVEIREKVKEAEEKYPKNFLNREALVEEIMRVYNVGPEDANTFCDDAGVYKDG